MADGTTLNSMSGGDKIRDIDRGANGKTQVVQVDVGGASAEALLVLGQQAKAASVPVALASDDDIQAKLGIVTETAPASDTASSGLNGRLQRIAQRLTSLIALVPASLGQKAMSASLAVVLASDQGTIGVQAGKSVIISANFTRPADTTAYASGDLVANSTTAGSVSPLSFSSVVRVAGVGALLRKAKLRTGNTSLTNASFRIHFYGTTETSSAGDNAAIVLPDMANYRGSIDVTLDKATSDGALGFGVPAVGDSIIVNPASGTSLFAFIEARAAYTPTSAQVFTVELELLQD